MGFMSKDTYEVSYLAFFVSNSLLSISTHKNTQDQLSQLIKLYSQNLYSHNFLKFHYFPTVVCGKVNRETTN
jgi:hypothetical protein